MKCKFVSFLYQISAANVLLSSPSSSWTEVYVYKDPSLLTLKMLFVFPSLFWSPQVMTSAVGDNFLSSLPHVSSTSVGTGRCLSLCLLLVIVYWRFCLFVCPFWLGLKSGLKTLTLAASSFLVYFLSKIRTSESYPSAAFGVMLCGSSFMFKNIFCQNIFPFFPFIVLYFWIFNLMSYLVSEITPAR